MPNPESPLTDAPPSDAKEAPYFSDEAMYEVLFRAIHEHHLLPNTHLREDELAKAFFTSRTRVRKMLQRLIFEGLVTQVPHKGSFVTALTSEQVHQLFVSRQIIELGIIEQLSLPIPAEQLATLSQLIQAENTAKHANNRTLTNKLSGDIHIFLAQLTNNAYLINFLTQLIAQTSLAIAIYGTHNPSICDNDDEAHAKLLTLLAQKNKPALSEHLAEHLRHIEQQLLVMPNTTPISNIGRIITQLTTA